MIHSGAIVGAGLSQFRSLLFKSVDFPYPYFRSDRYTIIIVCSQMNATLLWHAGINVILLPVEQLLEWQLPLGPLLVGYYSV